MVQAVIPTTVTGMQGRPIAATPAPTNNQALIWNGSAWVPGGPYLTAAGAPYIATNYVDNSGFTINQRGNTSGNAIAAGNFVFDRWKAGASGCTATFTAAPASTVITISAGTIQQVIEGANFFNSPYTLSWTGSATGRVNTGAYVASPITFTGAPNTNVTIEFQGGTLGQVLLQVGSQATLWQPQPAQVEFARCQRFYQTCGSYALGVSGFTLGQTDNIGVPVMFAVTMRAAPTINFVVGSRTGSGTTLAASVTPYGFAFAQPFNAANSYNFWNGAFMASADL